MTEEKKSGFHLCVRCTKEIRSGLTPEDVNLIKADEADAIRCMAIQGIHKEVLKIADDLELAMKTEPKLDYFLITVIKQDVKRLREAVRG